MSADLGYGLDCTPAIVCDTQHDSSCSVWFVALYKCCRSSVFMFDHKTLCLNEGIDKVRYETARMVSAKLLTNDESERLFVNHKPLMTSYFFNNYLNSLENTTGFGIQTVNGRLC